MTPPLKNLIAQRVRLVAELTCQEFDCPKKLREQAIREGTLMDVLTSIILEYKPTRDLNTYVPLQYNEVFNKIMDETIVEMKTKVEKQLLTLPKKSELN